MKQFLLLLLLLPCKALSALHFFSSLDNTIELMWCHHHCMRLHFRMWWGWGLEPHPRMNMKNLLFFWKGNGEERQNIKKGRFELENGIMLSRGWIEPKTGLGVHRNIETIRRDIRHYENYPTLCCCMREAEPFTVTHCKFSPVPSENHAQNPLVRLSSSTQQKPRHCSGCFIILDDECVVVRRAKINLK